MLTRTPALRVDLVAAVLLAAAMGAVAGRWPEYALAAAGVALAVVATLALQERALPFFVVVVAVIPYFPTRRGFEGDPIVPVGLISSVFIAAVLGPFLWSAATRRIGRGVKRTEVLIGVATAVVFALSVSLRHGQALTTLATGAFLAGLLAYLCSKRFTQLDTWGLPSVVGLLVLISLGLGEYSSISEDRIGYFVGYPILYAVLIVLLLPPALAWLHPRSRPAALAMAAFGVIALILSQTRSAWLGLIVAVAVLGALLFRWGRPRTIVALFVATVLISLAVVVNSDLSKVVESRLSRENVATQAFTHREYTYGYTFERFAEYPIAGRGWAGALKDDISARTGLSAADNGFLSLAGDLGLLGLLLGLIPVGVAAGALARLWRTRQPDPAVVALTLSLVGGLVATAFFDTFYWPQSAVLIFGMAGSLGARLMAQPDARPAA